MNLYGCLLVMGVMIVALVGGCPQATDPDPNANDNTNTNTNDNTEPSPDRPLAAFSASVVEASDPLRVLFNAAASQVTGAATYAWDFGDGETETVTTNLVEHLYASGGQYRVQLTVTDTSTLEGIATEFIIVEEPPATLSAIAVTPTSLLFETAGTTATLSVLGTYTDGATVDVTSDTNMTFSSSNAQVASVSAAGVVTPHNNGQATITAALGELTATVTVEVNLPAAINLTLSASPSTTVLRDAELTLTAQVASGLTITSAQWTLTSGDGPTNPFGTPAAVSTTFNTSVAGSFTATCSVTIADGRTASTSIGLTVNAPAAATLSSIAVAPATLSFAGLGLQQLLTVTGTYSDASTADLTNDSGTSYASSNTSVATVSSTGRVTAIGYGSAVVTVTHGSFTATTNVDVGGDLPVTITASAGTAVVVDQALTLTAAFTGGETIDTASWELTSGTLSNPFGSVHAASTTFNTSKVGTYGVSVTLTDDDDRVGFASVTITVTANALTVSAGSDSAKVPNDFDFSGATAFGVNAILTSGLPNGEVSSLGAAASLAGQSGATYSYQWGVASVPAPAASANLPDVLLLNATSANTAFQIRPVVEQISLLGTGEADTIANAVVPGQYSFQVTADAVGAESPASDTVVRTVSAGFEVLPTAADEAFEGLAIRNGGLMRRVLRPAGKTVPYTALNRHPVTLRFDLLDDGKKTDELGNRTPIVLPATYTTAQATTTLSSHTLGVVNPPALASVGAAVDAPLRGTYLLRATLTAGLLPDGITNPQYTGCVVHVQPNLPSVLSVAPTYVQSAFNHIGLVNSAAGDTVVATVAAHGARTKTGGGTHWDGQQVLSTDLNNDDFGETVVVSGGSVRMFTGLAHDPLTNSPIDNTKNNGGVLGGSTGSDQGVELKDLDNTSVCFGDVNDDGYDDLVVGRGTFAVGSNGIEGRVDIYFHNQDETFNANPYGTTPNVTITRPSDELLDSDLFGYSVACGDFTGDGIDDVLVGAPGTELETGITLTVDDASSSPDLRVVSADGLAVGDRLILRRGSVDEEITTIEEIDTTGPLFDRIVTTGYSVANLYDPIQRVEATGAVYGFAGEIAFSDGVDVMVYDNGAGATFRFIPSGVDDQALLGAAVATDPTSGTTRMIAGAPGRNSNAALVRAGAVFAATGGSALIDLNGDPVLNVSAELYEGPVAELGLGRRLAVGNLNGTGAFDIVASGSMSGETTQLIADAEGAVWIIPGGTTSQVGDGLLSLPHLYGAEVSGGAGPSYNLGAALACGDLNGDGLDDLVATAPSVEDVNQRVIVMYGRSSLPVSLPQDVTLLHHSDQPFLNQPVGVAGVSQTALIYRADGVGFADVNGDQIEDLLIQGLTGSDFEALMVAGRQ